MIKEFFQKLFGTTKNETILKSKSETNHGKVKFYNRTKGFGFINRADSDEELFFHKTNLNDRVKENDPVTFDLEKGEKGWAAVNVTKVKKGAKK